MSALLVKLIVSWSRNFFASMELKVHYCVYKNPSFYLVLNLFKLFVINRFVPELMPLGQSEKDEN
jgi:hypothetical protein